MKGKALFILACLLTCAVLGACRPSQTEPDAQATAVATDTPASQTVEVPTFAPIPTSAPTRMPASTPVVPSSFDSIEDLMPIFDYAQEVSLDVEPDLEGVEVHDISYASPMGGRVTAYLVLPPGEGPFAGVVFMHGAGGNRSQFLPEAVTLAKTGAVSLLVDGPTSRPEPWRRNPSLSDLVDYRTVLIQAIVDLRRAVDVLASRPDVDANRIGFVGYSYGAILGGVLAGVEHRIKAYVLMAGYPRFSDAMPPEHRSEQYIQTMEPIDPIHYIGHAAPSALLFQFGFYDQSISPNLALEYIDEASEPKVTKWYHEGHGLGLQAFYDRAEWLATQIGLDTSLLWRMRSED